MKNLKTFDNFLNKTSTMDMILDKIASGNEEDIPSLIDAAVNHLNETYVNLKMKNFSSKIMFRDIAGYYIIDLDTDKKIIK